MPAAAAAPVPWARPWPMAVPAVAQTQSQTQ